MQRLQRERQCPRQGRLVRRADVLGNRRDLAVGGDRSDQDQDLGAEIGVPRSARDVGKVGNGGYEAVYVVP